MKGQIRRLTTTIVALLILASASFAGEWTAGNLTVLWEDSPDSAAAVNQQFDATATGVYDPNMPAGTEWEYTTVDIEFQWEVEPESDGSATPRPRDWEDGEPGQARCKSTADIVFSVVSSQAQDTTVRVRAHVTGSILDYGDDGEKGTGDDVTYSIDEWSTSLQADMVIYKIVMNHCPAHFVPGHNNDVTYQIYPNDYTGTYGCFQIYKRDANGDPFGNAVYSSTSLEKAGGAERTFTYSGIEVNHADENYVVKISIGQDENHCSSDTAQFDVVGYNINILAWDYLSNNFCDGVDPSTVTRSTVKIRVKAFDDASYNDALPITAYEVPDTADYAWYYDRGGVEITFDYVFYVMTEQSQYYYLKYEVEEEGLLDFGKNMYDQDHSTETCENGYIWKFRINDQGDIIDIENPVELTRQ